MGDRVNTVVIISIALWIIYCDPWIRRHKMLYIDCLLQAWLELSCVEIFVSCCLVERNLFPIVEFRSGIIVLNVTRDLMDERKRMLLERKLCTSMCRLVFNDITNSSYHISIIALRPRQNGRHFADDIFKCIFLNENDWIPMKISLKFVPQGPINNIPALVQIMAWRWPGDKPLSGPMMDNYIFTTFCWSTSLTHMYAPKPTMIQ